MNMNTDTKLFWMMAKGYTLDVEYLGYDIGFHYILIYKGARVAHFTSLNETDIDGVEAAYLRHHRDQQLKSILDDVKINHFNATGNLES